MERERAARKDAEHRQALLERVEESRARLVRGFTHDVKNPLVPPTGGCSFCGTVSSGPLRAISMTPSRKCDVPSGTPSI
ncbi:MAG TPA: hypothetical protein VMM17_01185 [Gemmatimonadaceae bacterium]|nr:hypothetical protein [Gemmatimonadaceae bacterium]